ncbi:MAG: alternative ribosome rescue aminoacyl-tRNA hydrolase ArfB [Flavobacteriaceae bacterium]
MDRETLKQELKFKAVRSSGAGGQHVNKVSSKIELSFDVENSNGISDTEKERIYKKLHTRLTKENILLLQSDTHRSQHRNKETVIRRFLKIIENALKVPKKRRKTKPSKNAIEKRLKSKKKIGLKKVNRGKPELD